MPLRADPRCFSDAGWEPAGGSVPAPRFAHPRAGYRSAQDLSRRRCRRRRVPVVQTAEQLVEVPEFVSFAFLFQQQIADAPGRPRGLLPGQDNSLVWEQIEDTPVPHGRGRARRGGLLT